MIDAVHNPRKRVLQIPAATVRLFALSYKVGALLQGFEVTTAFISSVGGRNSADRNLPRM